MSLSDRAYLTYDDVLLKPGYSEVLPSEVHLNARFSRRIDLKIPLISAAMDTVTEALEKFRGDEAPGDDITLVVIKVDR